MSRQLADLTAGSGIQPCPVSQKEIRPADQAIGVRVANDRPHHRPRSPVRLDQGLGPARLGEGMIFREDDHRRACSPHSRRVRMGDRCDLANLDDVDPTKVVQLAAGQSEPRH